jgi:hypothetical protein
MRIMDNHIMSKEDWLKRNNEFINRDVDLNEEDLYVTRIYVVVDTKYHNIYPRVEEIKAITDNSIADTCGRYTKYKANVFVGKEYELNALITRIKNKLITERANYVMAEKVVKDKIRELELSIKDKKKAIIKEHRYQIPIIEAGSLYE